MSGNNMIVIETARLNIRKYTDEDTAALSAILSDPLTMAFWPAPFTSRQTEEWIERNIQSYLTQGFGRWAVELKETGRLIGDAGIIKLELNGRVENDLGYIIHSDYWRQGYAYEAAKSILNYAIQELGLDRICINMPADHVASEGVAIKLGLKKETEYRNRRNRDKLTCLYSSF
ncbi:GNAT family N-acetyltransferase [Paenibacillus riograndensis]|uniref:GCN5-like N-acetyltransferase n=1 Tax=Paenibacillus riograndensis SBR5 TaxID=1073571 RepID=A0A0E4HCL5_9BACL|nr:GNAT family N-acetyltransferase [Paenibacillus riograndensis]CQR54606.1 GCN5-like N-acetyltransferase [Paenibacillus riograndensis SBR5]